MLHLSMDSRMISSHSSSMNSMSEFDKTERYNVILRKQLFLHARINYKHLEEFYVKSYLHHLTIVIISMVFLELKSFVVL